MSSTEWRRGEIAVIGLGKSGESASTLLARDGLRVYASDAARSPALERGAELLRGLGVAVDVGRHDLDRIARASLVVVSPGVPPDAPPLARAREANIPLVSEIEIGLRYLPASTRYIAVTGTNGKTTTTALTGHLLRALGLSAEDAGNIGTPLTQVALAPDPPAWIALEISSFQLHDTPSINPTVGVLTNLSPDHLDRYATVEEYYADKALLFRNASERSKWVVNCNDQRALGMIAQVKGEHFYFGWFGVLASPDMQYEPDSMSDEEIGARGGTICWNRPGGSELLIDRDELHLIGDHNVENAMAAALAVIVADERHQTPEALARIAEGLRSFRPLEHRLEIVGEFDGVLWINDSKATNVSSALVALKGMTRPTIMLLGGRHKGEPYTALAEPLRKIGKAVIAYGEAGPIIARDLAGVVPIHHLGSDFNEVIMLARSLAAPGDTVLLSPACSSYDMFANYAERGATFKRLAGGGE